MEEDRITLSVSFEIKGKKKGRKTMIEAGAIKKGCAFDLEGIAKAYSIGETVAAMSGTGLDYVLNDYKKVFKATDEDVKLLMDKWWYKRKITINDLIDSYQKLQSEPVIEDLLIQHLISKLVGHFDRMPTLIKQSLLYAIFKHYENQSIEEIKSDIENVPQWIKDFIDSKLFKND